MAEKNIAEIYNLTLLKKNCRTDFPLLFYYWQIGIMMVALFPPFGGRQMAAQDFRSNMADGDNSESREEPLDAGGQALEPWCSPARDRLLTDCISSPIFVQLENGKQNK